MYSILGVLVIRFINCLEMAHGVGQTRVMALSLKAAFHFGFQGRMYHGREARAVGNSGETADTLWLRTPLQGPV